MPKIEETPYGLKVTFETVVDVAMASRMVDEFRRRVHPREGGFAILVDLRATRSFPAEVQEVIKQAILILREAGMHRNAVIVHSTIAGLQARRMVKETGIAPELRYFDADLPDWEETALAWLVDGTEPPPAD
ncbi:MAG TPA: hypothetical protein VN783_08385 [Thermoanaerobaculia bacterium]|nr:hypothetical protein [Thermoanaerobaculia bacterium]